MSSQHTRGDKDETIDTNTYLNRAQGNTLSDIEASRELNQYSDAGSNVYMMDQAQTSYEREFGGEARYVYKSHMKQIKMVRP